jgi:hypothetical protein
VSVPFALHRLVGLLAEHALGVRDLFAVAGESELVKAVRECLDSVRLFSSFLSLLLLPPFYLSSLFLLCVSCFKLTGRFLRCRAMTSPSIVSFPLRLPPSSPLCHLPPMTTNNISPTPLMLSTNSSPTSAPSPSLLLSKLPPLSICLPERVPFLSPLPPPQRTAPVPFPSPPPPRVQQFSRRKKKTRPPSASTPSPTAFFDSSRVWRSPSLPTSYMGELLRRRGGKRPMGLCRSCRNRCVFL